MTILTNFQGTQNIDIERLINNLQLLTLCAPLHTGVMAHSVYPGTVTMFSKMTSVALYSANVMGAPLIN